MTFASPAIGHGHKVGDRVLIAGQPYYWVITGVKLNMKRGKLVELSRQAMWPDIHTEVRRHIKPEPVTITTSVPVTKIEKADPADLNRAQRRRK